MTKKFKAIHWAMIFLALGWMTSPTVVSLYHIVIFIPALLLFKEGPKLKLPNSAKVLLILTGWGLVSTLVNISTIIKPNKSFQELKYYLFGVLLIYPLRYFFKHATQKQIRILLNILFITIIAAFFVGISKAWFSFDPVKMQTGEFHNRSGGFTNYMRYGYASAFLFLFSLAAFFNREKLKAVLNPYLFYSAFVLNLLAVGTSQTRGGLLALMVGIPVLLYKYYPRLVKVCAGFGVVFVGVVLYISFASNSKHRFLDINDGSNYTRMSQFYTAVMVIKDNPVFGLGADQFSYNVTEYKKKYDIWRKKYSGHAHNIFLEHGANYGVLGALLLAAFLLFWLFEMYKAGTPFAWAIASYICAFTVSGQVELLFDVMNSHLLFFVYSLSLCNSLNIGVLPDYSKA